MTGRLRMLSLVLLLALHVLEGAAYDHSGYLRYYRVADTVQTARELLNKANVFDTSNRLAVMLLYSSDIANREYGPCMKGSFEWITKNLQNTTKADLFLFVKQVHFQAISSRPWIRAMHNLFMLTLDDNHNDSSWRTPNWLRLERYGWSTEFSEEYRLMGHWRLSFSFPFANALGYKYLLQMDTDTYITERIPYDIVTFMKERQLYVTDKEQPTDPREIREYHLGLPELAKFWLLTRRAIKGYSPLVTAENASAAGIKGPIFKHCRPANLLGLRTQDTASSKDAGWEGWDAKTIAGHFNVFSLDWWFSWEVQDFVQLVLRTGAHIEHRWVDIATQSMIIHLFCPEDKLHVHRELRMDHGRGDWRPEYECDMSWLD